jgi:serine/threonine-protein kinase
MDAAQDLLGRTLSGRFQVTAFIGEGAMANVYRAVDLAAPSPREIALKVMHPHLTMDRTFVSRFRREAKAAQKLEHPSSVQVIEHGVDQGVVYIAMELLAGRDLFEVLVVERRFAEARAARILVQICDALSAAHAVGIVHRDLKPENIMLLDADGRADAPRVKVLDFGIAKLLERDLTSSRDDASSAPSSSLPNSVLTTVGVVVGTPAYMSPEQCRGDAVDARSDIYACGVLLYQLLTGRLPFTGSTPVEIAMAQLQSAPAPPSTLLERLHPALEATILTALSKWPAQRQQSAAELKAELEQVLSELSEVAAAPRTEAHRAGPAPESEDDDDDRHATTLASRVTEVPSVRDPEHEPTRRSAVAPPPAADARAEPRPTHGPNGTLVGELAGMPPTVRDERPSRAASAALTWLVLAAAVLLGAAFGAVAFWLSR